MKFSTTAIALGALMFASVAQADPVIDRIVGDLKAQGYTRIELKAGPSRVKAEATRGGETLHATYRRSNGALLSSDGDASDGIRIGTMSEPVRGSDVESSNGGHESGSDNDNGAGHDRGSDNDSGNDNDNGSNHDNGSDNDGGRDHDGGSDNDGGNDHDGGSDNDD